MSVSGSEQCFQLALYTTGGTIDGAYSDKGTIRSESDAAKWLKEQKNIEVNVFSIFNKDSREITEVDRLSILNAIKSSKVNNILLTHGTWTISQTGRVLKQALANTSKKVLLVGAWAPFGGTNSDAPKQMEFALNELLDERSGVWIAIDGKLLDPDKTEKVKTANGFALVEQD